MNKEKKPLKLINAVYVDADSLCKSKSFDCMDAFYKWLSLIKIPKVEVKKKKRRRGVSIF